MDSTILIALHCVQRFRQRQKLSGCCDCKRRRKLHAFCCRVSISSARMHWQPATQSPVCSALLQCKANTWKTFTQRCQFCSVSMPGSLGVKCSRECYKCCFELSFMRTASRPKGSEYLTVTPAVSCVTSSQSVSDDTGSLWGRCLRRALPYTPLLHSSL